MPPPSVFLPLLLLLLSTLPLAVHPLPSCSSSFDYSYNGKDWQGLCATGKHQSPINIQTSKAVCDASLQFNLIFIEGSSLLDVKHNGHSIQVDDEISALFATNLDGHLLEYQAEQFHFHSPSEHTMDGRSFDLEMHIVHSVVGDMGKGVANTGGLAVIAVLFEVDDSAGPHPLIEALEVTNVGKLLDLDIQTLLGKEISSSFPFYSYKGSLTTPPCSESVTWYVLEQTQKITSKQLRLLTQKHNGHGHTRGGGKRNNRAVQALNGRQVMKGGTKCGKRIASLFSYLYD